MPRNCLPLLLLSLGACAAWLHSAELETVLGEKFAGEIQAISADGIITSPDLERAFRIAEIRVLVWREVPETPPAKIVAEGSGGAKYHWNSLRFNGDEFVGAFAAGPEIALPFDGLRAIRFDPRASSPAFEEALLKPSTESDKIFLKVDKQLETISGLLAGITDTEITLEVAGAKKTLSREKVYGLVLAQTGAVASPVALVALDDGSRLAANGVEFQASLWKVKLPSGKICELPASKVVRIDFRPAGLKFVSDLDPLEVKEESWFASAQPFVKLEPSLHWKRDRNVRGAALKLAGRTYERGLGVHSRSELTFAVPTGSKWFLATVGIDDSATHHAARSPDAPQGDCEMRVLGDGRELFAARVKSAAEPQLLQVDVTGVKQLTLLVEPGENQDFADHANWCDARFLPAIPSAETRK